MVRRAFGIADVDVTKRAKTLLDEAELEHRSKYGASAAPRQWPFEAAIAAESEPAAWITATSAELCARMRMADPVHPWGMVPEYSDARIITMPRSAARG